MNFEIESSKHKLLCLFSILYKKNRKSGIFCTGIEYTHFPVEIPPQTPMLLDLSSDAMCYIGDLPHFLVLHTSMKDKFLC